ncbi:hypothetical protein JCM8097_004602 [Rhodosporidiobolus ruineniae]
MAQAAVEHLLAHHLAQADQLPLRLASLLDSLTANRTLAQLEHDEGSHGPLMHRWQLRLTSLVAASQPPPIRTAGFHLLHHTYTASTQVLLQTGKTALSFAQAVLNSPKSDPELFCAALELASLVLAKSTYHPEWARDNVGAQTAQKIVHSLVQAASVELSEVVHPCVSTIVALLPLFPTALRPLSPALHTLAISLISAPSASASTVDAGAHLFVSLYLLAPKGREGLREAWKTGVEALIGSIDGLATQATSGIFSEDILYNHNLSPLALPPLPPSSSTSTSTSPSPLPALTRLESLSRVLLLALRTPTSEKAGTVPLPLGALVELALRLTSLSSQSPVKERTDPTVLTEVTAVVLPRLQLVGCKLAAQLALAVPGSQLALYASALLAALARTLGSYAPRSPMRPALSTTYSIVLQALGASVDPEEGKKSLARVWRTVLEDVGGVALEPVLVAAAEGKENGAGGNSRKAKRQRTYDPSESMAARRVAVDEADLDIAERGLATLERLLLTPHAHFLPPKLQLSTSRLLLFLSLSPSFFLTHPFASTSSASCFPATSASRALEIAKQSTGFRRGVVRALKASLEAGVGGDGTRERAVEVWRRGVLDQDDEISSLSHTALTHLHTLIHPLLPPQQPNTSLARQVFESHGGAFVGDEVDYRETAEEFRTKVTITAEGVQDGESSEDDEEDGMKVDAAPAAPAAPAPAPAPAFAQPAVSTFATQPASSGFASFAAPSFGSKPAAPAAAPSPAPTPTIPASAPAPAPAPTPAVEVEIVRSVVSTSTTVTAGGATTSSSSSSVVGRKRSADELGAGADGDEDSDDEAMPVIDLGSDEE